MVAISRCLRCNKIRGCGYTYCDECHAIVVADMHARENLPVGRLSSSPEFEADEKQHGGTHGRVCEGGGDRIIRKRIDDDNPSGENAVRAMEDVF